MAEQLYTYQPALRIPSAAFSAGWQQAERLFLDRQSRHLGGVLAAFRWVANVEEKAPITSRRIRATSWTMFEEARCACAAESELPPPIAYEIPPGKVIAPEYGIGVSQALEWARGLREDCPVPAMP